jgi:hypothetical protein
MQQMLIALFLLLVATNLNARTETVVVALTLVSGQPGSCKFTSTKNDEYPVEITRVDKQSQTPSFEATIKDLPNGPVKGALTCINDGKVSDQLPFNFFR